MKKILSLLLLLPLMAISQTVPADATALENIQITNNTTSLTATKVNVQDANGVINTIPKSELINVIEKDNAPELPLIGEAGKIYVVKNINKIYRWNGTFYQELAVTDISGKANNDEVVFNTGNQVVSGNKSFTDVISFRNNVEVINSDFPESPTIAITMTTDGDVTAKKFIKTIGSTNILLAGGTDMAQGTAFNKNFGTIAGTVVEGGSISGTVGYLPKFTSSGTIGNGSIFDNGNIGIGTTTPTSAKLQIASYSSLLASLYVYNPNTTPGGSRGIYVEGGTNSDDYSFIFAKANGEILFSGKGDGKIETISPITSPVATTDAQLPTLGQVKALFSSGTYTPTLTAVANTSVNSLTYASYTKVGDIVSVQCSVNISITAGTAISRFKITLPINSSISATNLYCGQGTLYTSATATQSIPSIVYRNGQTEAIVLFNSETGIGPRDVSFSFQYKL